MYCPNCQTLCEDSDNFCYLCGAPLKWQKPRKGSRWVPILILFILSVTGIALFFATANRNSTTQSTSDSAYFQIRDGVLYFDKSSYTGGSELVIPNEIGGETVFALGKDCFANCTELTTVILPSTLSSIGENAFYGCTSLRGITIPESVNIIAEKAFYGCSNLEAIRIPGTLHTIRKDAFDNCSYLGYIFYEGTHDRWTALYDAFINPYVVVICQDGSFYQGGEVYE